MGKKEKVKVKKEKKKMTRAEKNRLMLKIAGWFMALIMIIGTLVTIFIPLIYRQ